MPATTSVSPSGNQDIDGLLYVQKWAVSSFTFSFPTSGSFYEPGSAPGGETASNFGALNATQQNYVRGFAFQQFASVANLTFTEMTETASQHADLRFAKTDSTNTAWGYFPSSGGYGGDTWYRNSGGNYDNPVIGNYAAHTFLHEIGHAFGLEHGHDSANPFGKVPNAHDSVEYTIMTYRSYVDGPLNGYTYGGSSAPQTLMQNDIAALQYLYGANYNTNSGNTVYSWNSSTGQTFINGVSMGAVAGNKIFMTLWDGGGVDTYDLSAYATNLTINLQPGAWSTFSSTQRASLGSGNSAAGNVANALLYNNNQQSLIENAIGGSGNDTIVGNAASNQLSGGIGNDTLDGAGSNDVLWGDAGNDTFVYSSGHDTIMDFVAGAGGIDVIDLRGVSGILSLADVLARASQVGANTVIDFGGGNTLTLQNVTMANLVSGDFLYFVPVPQPDLVTSGFALNGSSVSYTINNTGTSASVASTTGIYLSTDATITSADTRIASIATASIAAGGSLAQGATLTFPTNLTPGTYYLGALADYAGQVGESNESNNASNAVAVMIGNTADNTITGTAAADSVFGLTGNDILLGNGGNDLLYGSDGGDWLIGNAGADMLDGGAGYDYARYDYAPGAVVVSLANPASNTGDAAGDSYSSIEGLIGSAFDDTLTGNGGDNDLWSLAGNDILDGGAGNDTLWGGDGNDTFVYSTGRDTIYDFVAGAGGIDAIDLRGVAGILSLADVLARATQVGANTVIDFGGGNVLTLQNVTRANLVSGDFLFTAPASLADLTASSFALNGTSVTYTINNIGAAASSASTAGIYLSTDATITSADTRIASVATSALAAGGSLAQGATLTFPTNLTPGTYYLGALADYAGQVGESSEANNASNAVAVVLGNTADNTLTGTASADTVFGMTGNDILLGNGGNDLLFGGDGLDWLVGHAGADTLDGGAGYDYARYDYAPGAVVASLVDSASNTGDAAGDSYISIEGLIGSAFGDTLTGNGGDNDLWSLAGNDILDGGAGNDTLWGGADNDTFVYSTGLDAIMDFVAGASGIDVIDLRGVSGILSLADVLARATQVGANTVIDFGGGNTLTLQNVTRSNLVSGDFLFSVPATPSDLTASSLVLNGTSVNFTINNIGAATSAASTTGLYLSADSTITTSDTLLTSVATASLAAGASLAQGATLTFPTNLTAGTYYIGALADYAGQVGETNEANNASNAVAVVLGNTADNTITGTASADTIFGMTGNDILLGNGGNDLLSGGDGGDWLVGNGGADILDGGAGYDYARYDYAPGAVIASLTNPASNTGDAAGDSYSSIEGLIGSAFDDTLTGNGGDNDLWSLAGNDTLDGGTGNDTMWGGDGNDTFVYSTGRDTIYDFIAGAGGIDTVDLSGVAGIESLTDVLAKATQVGANTVIDFGGGNTLTLQSVTKINLISSDFIY